MAETQTERIIKTTGMVLCVIVPIILIYMETIVREKKANAWLLHEMHGHLFEDHNEWR